MTSDLDIYRTASVLIKQHGEDATIHAAMRAVFPPSYLRISGWRLAATVIQ